AVPQFQELVAAARDDVFAAGAVDGRRHRRAMALEDVLFLAGPRLPDLDQLVGTRRDDVPAVRTEQGRPDRPLMYGQFRLLLVAVPLPQPYGLVVAAGGQRLAIGAESHTAYRLAVSSLESADGPSGGDIPQADARVIAARGQALAVRAEGQAADQLRVSV